MSQLLAQTNEPDLTKQPTLYVVGYAHLDTEWRWEYPQVINEYLRNTMEDNFVLFDKHPHYVFNFSGTNRYRLMKEYYPEDFAKLKKYVGQWDDRQWSKSGADDDYGEMTGLKPGYIKRADLAWYCSHHHNAAGENVAYQYSYLFVYPIQLPAGARTIQLLSDNKIRVLAISVANMAPEIVPVQPLYDVLPAPSTIVRTSLAGGTGQ